MRLRMPTRPTAQRLEPRILFFQISEVVQFPPAPSPALGPPDLRVTLDYTYDTGNFFDTLEKRAALQRAADAAVFLLSDDLAAIQPGGMVTWEALFESPSVGTPDVPIPNLTVPQDEMIVYAGARDLPGGMLSRGVPGGHRNTALMGGPQWEQLLDERVLASSDVFNGHAPWGGSVAFDADPALPWHFGESTDGLEGRYDFFTAATRAFAQLLGFGTSDEWASAVRLGQFTGTSAAAANGGPVQLDATLAHFLGDQTAMTPTQPPGVRQHLTTLDYAALVDLGWTTTGRMRFSPAPAHVAPGADPLRFDVTYHGRAPWVEEPLWLHRQYDEPGLPAAVVASRELTPTSRTVTYAFEPPGGAWDRADNDTYYVTTAAGGLSGSTVGRVVVDVESPPTASVTPWPVSTPTRTPHRLELYFNDDHAIDPASIDPEAVHPSVLLITGPGGAALSLARIQWAFPPTTPSHYFRAAIDVAPPGGAWGPEDNGEYTFALAPGVLRDVSGNVSPGGTFGKLLVDIRTDALRRQVLRSAADKPVMTVSLSGPGTMYVTPAAAAGPDVARVELTGTTEASTLSLRGPRARGASVAEIVADGPLGAILAPDVTLAGTITVAGALRRLRLRDNRGPATITVGPGPGLDVAIESAAALALDSASPIRTLSVGQWLKGDAAGPSRIVAPSIGSLSALSRAGRFEADVTAGSIGRARFAGALASATLRSAGPIGAVSAASVSGSRIFAGVADAVTGLPASPADFANGSASIGSLAVRGTFTDSLVAAPTIGRLTLPSVPTSNNNRPFGVAADLIRSAAVTVGPRALRLSNLGDPARSASHEEFVLRAL